MRREGKKGGTFCAGEARAAPTREDGGKGDRGVKGWEAEGRGELKGVRGQAYPLSTSSYHLPYYQAGLQ